jgi:hypothetical protein
MPHLRQLPGNRRLYMLTDESEIYTAAWSKWHDLQYVMLFEEMAELQKAVTKYLRNGSCIVANHEADIAEEIADVQIMLDQMKQRFGKEECEEWRQVKLKRLAVILKAGD